MQSFLLCAGLGAAPFVQAAVSGVQASNDLNNLAYQISYTGSPNYFRIYLDTDRNVGSGFRTDGVGANFLIENGSLYRYTGNGSANNWSWSAVKDINFSRSNGVAKWTLARADLGAPTSVDLVAQIEAPKESAAKVTQTVSDPVVADISAAAISSDATNVYYQSKYVGAPTYFRVYIDSDKSATTGFQIDGVGANYLVENGGLYRYTGSGNNWSWAAAGNAGFSKSGGVVQWSVARSDLGSPQAVDVISQIEAPKITAAKSSHVLSNAIVSGIGTPTASSDATTMSYQVQYAGTPSYYRIYLDSDKNAGTGFPHGDTGANYLIENDGLYRYTGSNGSWSWYYIKPVSFTKVNSIAKWTVARADIGLPANVSFVAETEAPKVASASVSQGLIVPPIIIVPDPAPAPTSKVSYSGTSAQIANPERGFYHQQNRCNVGAYNLATLKRYRTEEQGTLVLCVFYLDAFKNAPISQSVLDFWQAQMNTVRAAGLKAALRFAYTMDMAGDDASLPRVLQHLDQLAPYFAKNSDVIEAVQAGFIGAWGEWAFSQNFGSNNLTAKNWSDRKAVVDKLLQVLPASVMLQLRTPGMKLRMISGSAITAGEAFNGSAKARIGHHNDCFLASSSDMGTYGNTAVEYPYLAAETEYLPMGGETCRVSLPRSDCPTALAEMEKFHWSYLNIGYNIDVLNRWKSQGCFEQVKQKLGYRLTLQSGTYSTSAKAGGPFAVSLTLQNQGWAAVFHPRKAELVFRNTSTGALYRVNLQADPRRWLAGKTATVNETITLPKAMPAGNYATYLNFPDPAASLATRPEYAIQLANANLWDANTGFNNLNHTVSIAP